MSVWTSVSRRLGPVKWIATLLMLLVLFLLAIELATVFVFHRVSKLQHRTETEYVAARSMRPRAVTGRIEVLLTGNSLLGAAVDCARLEVALSPEIEVRRLVVEQTTYFDWYYGLRRLFREGARPDVVAVVLTSHHLTQSGVRGEYFARYMMSARDIVHVSRDIHLHPTATSNLLFGNASAFYGSRVEIRKWVLSTLLPNLPQLMQLLTRDTNADQPDAGPRLLTARIDALNELVREHGARLVLVPPPLMRGGSTALIERVANRLGVPVVTSDGSVTFGPEDFGDGFHLNEAGATKYTETIAPKLRNTVTRLYAAVPQRTTAAQ
jgi:hypothetical protein